MKLRASQVFVVFPCLLWSFAAADELTPVVARPDFSRDIQPIFARVCTKCHGGVKQAAELSFVYAESILPPDGWVVEPGKPDESILIERITSTDPDLRMPPPDEHPDPLSEEEIETIRRWIEQGARWTDHWSRTPLAPPPLPSGENTRAWSRQSLDYFVHDKLLDEGLEPSAEAEPEQWLRRVALDLVGLPPTLEQLETFQTAVRGAPNRVAADEVYSTEVDRLLASEHFGERWAALWLDLARYADSKGFEKDPHRDMWPYRDWLIEAFNRDMPYDEFTIKQLAGDLLPNPTYDDLVATAFHRNTQTNTEGGTDDEEYRTAAVIDRLNTTWTVWQATTFGCVQCHAHPYEPFQNAEFYAGLALFNNTEDTDLDSDFPTLPALDNAAERQAWVDVQRQIAATQAKLDQLGRAAVEVIPWQLLPVDSLESTSGQIGLIDDEVRVIAGTIAVGSTYTLTSHVSRLTALRLTILPESNDPAKWPEQGSVLSQLILKVVDSDGTSRDIAIETVIPDYRDGSYACEEVLKSSKDGFGGYPKLLGPRQVVAVLKEPLALAEGEALTLELKQEASVTGGLSNHLRRFRLEFSDDDAIVSLAEQPEYKTSRESIATLIRELRTFKGNELPVMRERDKLAARPTRQFIRGNWLERGDVVEPGIPAIFQPTGDVSIDVADRLEFANWLVSVQNPLTARVWVNRVWAELFGFGIVETLEDFGVSGQAPSHPALLDYLAHSMQHEHRWRLKSLLRSIVLSATYRQESRVSPELRERDPRNRLLARGPRTRLTAEMVRDQALLAAGHLTDQVGGPSVMPPQPEGVWQQVYSGAQWETAEGPDRYRRGLYTYWKRTSPYPGFVMFDTPNRDVCSPRRIATNTPLQALVTLNSQVYTELAAALAKRCYAASSSDAQAAIRQMFVRVTSRQPNEADVAELMELYQSLLAERAARQQLAQPAESEPHATEPTAEAKQPEENAPLDPLAVVALAILNSDWALTK